jgi:lysine-N-methylase
MKPARLLQPSHVEAFHCVGAACEDTCCTGWAVHVDKTTYAKYQNCSDGSLRTLVILNEGGSNDEDYARIALHGPHCPFLSEGLCSIQSRWGEDYLSNMCATYPRVINRAGDVMLRSLDLSCPEAARLALLNPLPMEFDEQEPAVESIRPGKYPSLDISSLMGSPEPYAFFGDLRRLVISLLQNRAYPLWKRLFLVGIVCEKLQDVEASHRDRTAVATLARCLDGSGPDTPSQDAASAQFQLETVLELIVARISSDYNPPSFLACYQQFIDGLQWTPQSSLEDLGARYTEAYATYYLPYMSQHEYVLENYLVNYAHRTLFPLGLPERNRRLAPGHALSSLTAQYMLMIVHFSITQTLLIGFAGFHKQAFGAAEVLRMIQTSSKTFEHSLTYPAKVIEMLLERKITTPGSLSLLTRNSNVLVRSARSSGLLV